MVYLQCCRCQQASYESRNSARRMLLVLSEFFMGKKTGGPDIPMISLSENRLPDIRLSEEKSLHEAVILFDGVCNLCNNSVNFVIDRDKAGKFKFSALQSPEATPYLDKCEGPVGEGGLLSSILLILENLYTLFDLSFHCMTKSII